MVDTRIMELNRNRQPSGTLRCSSLLRQHSCTRALAGIWIAIGLLASTVAHGSAPSQGIPPGLPGDPNSAPRPPRKPAPPRAPAGRSGGAPSAPGTPAAPAASPPPAALRRPGRPRPSHQRRLHRTIAPRALQLRPVADLLAPRRQRPLARQLRRGPRQPSQAHPPLRSRRGASARGSGGLAPGAFRARRFRSQR